MRTRRLVLLAAAVAWCAASLTARQAATGRITGTATDRAGGALPGATIVLSSVDRGGRLSRTQSGLHGQFVFEALPPGVYRVDADIPGFDIARRSGIRVTSDAPVPAITLVMPVSTICECVSPGPQVGFATVTGTIVDVDGRPIPRALLKVSGVQAWGDSAYASATGEFTVRLPPGKTHTLLVSDPAFNPVAHQIAVGTRNSPVTVRLAARTPAPEPATEILKRGCRCASDLFTHRDR